MQGQNGRDVGSGSIQVGRLYECAITHYNENRYRGYNQKTDPKKAINMP